MVAEFKRCEQDGCHAILKPGKTVCWRHELVKRAETIRALTSEDATHVDRAQVEKYGKFTNKEIN